MKDQVHENPSQSIMDMVERFGNMCYYEGLKHGLLVAEYIAQWLSYLPKGEHRQILEEAAREAIENARVLAESKLGPNLP